MSTQLSPQIRVFALVGVLLIALGGGTLFYLHRSKSGAVTPLVATTQQTTTPASTAPSTTPASTTPSTTPASTTPSTTPASTTPSTTPAATTAHKVASPAQPVHVDSNLPLPLRTALEQSRIVVVALYDPQVRVDTIALAETRAGAAQAHVGFLRVNLLDNRVAGTLTALLPAGRLLPNPGFLVYRRPGTLLFRFDGYLDRDAIAQAVQAMK